LSSILLKSFKASGRSIIHKTMSAQIPIIEIFRAAHHALLRNWGRAVLTSLSMVVGTASLVLVVIAGISGRAYTLEQIQGVGTNLISIDNQMAPTSERLNLGDLKAIQTEVPGVQYASPLITNFPTIVMEGVTRRVGLIGTTPDYQKVRNILVLEGPPYLKSLL